MMKPEDYYIVHPNGDIRRNSKKLDGFIPVKDFADWLDTAIKGDYDRWCTYGIRFYGQFNIDDEVGRSLTGGTIMQDEGAEVWVGEALYGKVAGERMSGITDIGAVV